MDDDSRFDLVRKLGQGTYGKVQLGINKETGQEVCRLVTKNLLDDVNIVN